jgi:hypothetical protein
MATLAVAAPAATQTYTFGRPFPAGANARLDISAHRGTIVVIGDEDDQIVVKGTVSVRTGGLNMPLNRAQLASSAADHPSIRQRGSTIEVRPPDDPLVDRAVTVDYEVHVPPGISLVAVNDSGKVVLQELTGSVSVRTQSGVVDVAFPAAAAMTIDATTKSGAITVDRERVVVAGTVEKGRVRGTIHGGGVTMTLTSDRGDIRLHGSSDVQRCYRP